ncbi:double zinc ribbon domain-containing protein [Haloarchaeobius sp. TZWWS8]|uniref:double zinc ribbon domain-containing protein n=1 Tax=Haloarchaeobius sp. TZWWS8 TaxID=3446121 RepID=UPI003EB70263
MSKITVRADDELVGRLEAREESKSQLVREALRAYLDGETASASGPATTRGEARATPLDDLVADRVDQLIEDRLDDLVADRVDEHLARRQQDVNVTVSLDGAATSDTSRTGTSDAASDGRRAPQRRDVPRTEPEETCCTQCGDALDDGHVYCPNCGEKASRRAFCECGDEVRSDWAFCPGCGRRTPAADVLDTPSDATGS